MTKYATRNTHSKTYCVLRTHQKVTFNCCPSNFGGSSHESIQEIRFRQLAAVAMAVAGIIHLAIAPAHWQHAPGHGLFFASVGLIQLAWAVLFNRRPSPLLSTTGLIMALGLIGLWGITRVLPPPFESGPEAVNASGLACKLAEAIGATALAMAIYRFYLARLGRPAARRSLGMVMMAGLLSAGIGYSLARAGEPYLPALAEVHAAGIEDDHGAADNWQESSPISISEMEDRYGIHVTLVGVTAGGGLIDFRFKVLNPEKALAMLQDHEQMPKLVVEDSGAVLSTPGGMNHQLSLKQGHTFFMFYANRQNAIKPGTAVSVVIGDNRLEHVTAQ